MESTVHQTITKSASSSSSSSSARGGSVPVLWKPRISRNFPRSNNGCLTCRSRRKKCDESKPVCIGCVRNKLQCTWARAQPRTPGKAVLLDESQKNNSIPKVRGDSDLAIPFAELPDVLVGLTNQHTTPLQKPPSPNSDSSLHGSPDLNSNSANLLSSLSSFPLLRQISPKPRSQPGGFSYGQGVRANPNASLLFNYYVSQTAHQICAAPVHNNPFLNIVLPIAFSDHVVMNSVLAIAGAHLRFDETLNQETVTATWSHHSLVLRDLQLELSRSQLDQENEKLRMLLIILLLCMVESISGNSHDTFMHHLNAGRELVLSIISKPQGIEITKHHDLWNFLLEMYSYMALVATITPRGTSGTQNPSLNDFLRSAQGISKHGTSGSFLSGIKSVFKFIPEVSLLTSQRHTEEETGTCSATTYAQYKDLESRIRASTATNSIMDGSEMATQHAAALVIWQSALLIFLHSSFCESLQDDIRLITEIDIRVEMTLPLLESLTLTPLCAIMMWPAMIIGSCAHQERQWEMYRLAGVKYKMSAVKQATKLLNLLWMDPDPRAYGPRGLEFVMQKRGWNICMI